MRANGDIESDLARLTDGSLPADRSRELEARVAESPELQSLLAEQRRALSAAHMLGESAPPRLRARVEALRRRPQPRTRARRAAFAGGLAAAAAVVAIALVAILPSGAAGPSLADAAVFTLKAPLAPPPQHKFDGALDLTVDGVPYPYWQDQLGWQAVGKRVDRVGGRTATTVFYRKGGSRVGYTIVSGKPVSVSGSASEVVIDGVRFRSVPLRGTTVVTWERRNHSCIVSGRGLSRDQLLKLASWEDAGALPYPGRPS